MPEPLFYLQSPHGDLGTNCVFHNKGGAGYGTDIDGLREYSLVEAQQELGHRINALPLLTTKVQELSIKAVDCQYLDIVKQRDFTAQTECPDRYVIQIEGHWNGNDICFVTGSAATYDFSKAEVFTVEEAGRYLEGKKRYALWNHLYLDGISRRTFQTHNINTRSMITKPGLLYKKPKKRPPTSGKTRMNCPDCGRMHWQYNPYDFEGCNDFECKGWRPTHYES